MAKTTISKTLRAIAIALDELEQNDIDALVAGKGRLLFVASEELQASAPSPDIDIVAIVGRLSQCHNRDDAYRVLSDIDNKERLVLLAKAMKVHVVKHDRREDIESKIVAFAIGGKLRTEALQSINLRGGAASTEKKVDSSCPMPLSSEG